MHDREAMRSDGIDHVAPARAGLDVRDPGDRVDRDVSVVQFDPEQERVAQVRKGLGQVAGGLGGHPESVVTGVRDRGLNVLNARSDADGGRTLVGVQVPGAASGVVVR